MNAQSITAFVTAHLASTPPAEGYPLTDDQIGVEEVAAVIGVLLSKRLTHSPLVDEFEAEFAAATGAPYAVMVNSGSSANLLAVAAATNPARVRHLAPGDAVAVPAVCWSTSVAPILQMGCRPVYVDVDPATANMTASALEAAVRTQGVKGLVAVHALGNAAPLDALMAVVRRHDLVFIEDACEALGSRFRSRALGTFGDFGTFSFYYSHHITCGEGGMVVCRTLEDYNLLRCLRAHGWTRHLTNREAVESANADIDPRFLFVNTGFNVRPMSTQAAMARVQLRKLGAFVAARRESYALIRDALLQDARYARHSAYEVVRETPGVEASWFGVALLLSAACSHQLAAFKAHLARAGVEHRPVISGNMARQPFNKLYSLDVDPEEYPGAERLHHGALFVGLHSRRISDAHLRRLVAAVNGFDWRPRMRVLVTGGSGLLGNALRDLAPHGLEAEVRFLSSTDCDLRDAGATRRLFRSFMPTHVVHAAAVVGGLYSNLMDDMTIGADNVAINTNVMRSVLEFDVRHVLAVSSSCVFPAAEAEFDEDRLHAGAPHPSAADYAMAKRHMHVLCDKLRSRGVNTTVLIACNMYGPHDVFDPPNGHVVGDLVAKASAGPRLLVLGTGAAMRQFMYVRDFARIVWQALPMALPPALMCAPPDASISIRELAARIARLAGTTVEFDTTKSDGQLRKHCNTARFQRAFPAFEWTSLEDGLRATIDWHAATLADSGAAPETEDPHSFVGTTSAAELYDCQE